MNLSASVVAITLMLVAEIMELPEASKTIKPYKYYRPKVRNRGHRYHTFPRPSSAHRTKKNLAQDSLYRGSTYPRYGPLDEQPYTIVIQLPKRQDELEVYPRKYLRDFRRDRVRDDDYFDDDDEEEEDDLETKTLYVGHKRLRIKLVKGSSPKLHIKISRSDDGNDIKIVDKANATTTRVRTMNVKEASEGDWIPFDPLSSSKENARIKVD